MGICTVRVLLDAARAARSYYICQLVLKVARRFCSKVWRGTQLWHIVVDWHQATVTMSRAWLRDVDACSFSPTSARMKLLRRWMCQRCYSEVTFFHHQIDVVIVIRVCEE